MKHLSDARGVGSLHLAAWRVSGHDLKRASPQDTRLAKLTWPPLSKCLAIPEWCAPQMCIVQFTAENSVSG